MSDDIYHPSLFFEVEDEGIAKLLIGLDARVSDSLLYLGGRIDDNNLYPPDYCKYLNQKIKELNPRKIICHSHFYAWKYYEKGILDDSMKIDLIVCYRNHVKRNSFNTIDKSDYKHASIEHAEGTHLWCLKELIDKNIKTIFALYGVHTGGPMRKFVKFYTKWFKGCNKKYNLGNLKYFTFDRRYSPSDLTKTNLGHGKHTRNSTDGFGILKQILELGFQQVNILGFTAFGSDEDSSKFSKYISPEDEELNNRNYFEIKTSEDQKAEADILKYWIENQYIYNLEDYSKLQESV